MATFKTAPKIVARPQIKSIQKPIPRQVILPKKAQPVAKPVAKAPAKAAGMAMPTNVTPRQNVQISPAEAQRIMNMQKAPSIPMMAQPLPSLPVQQNTNYSQFQNPANLTMGQSSVGTVGYPSNGSGTSIYQSQQNPVMANMPVPTMGESSVGSIGYPTSMGGGITNIAGQPPFNPSVSTIGGFGQPQTPMGGGVAYQGYDYGTDFNRSGLPVGYSAGQNNEMFNPAYSAPNVNNPLFAGFSAPNPMFNSMYNAPDINNPLFAGFSAPTPNNMNQQGFVPMGGFGNIGSLLGKG